MLDNTLPVTISEKSDHSPAFPTGATLPAWIALGVSVAILAVLYAFNPYASGYGAHPVTIFHFATQLWKGEDWQHCYLVPLAVAAMVYFKRRQLRLDELGLPGDPVRFTRLRKITGDNGFVRFLESAWLRIREWSGPVLTIFGFAVYWLGFRADNIYLGYFSFQILTAGLLLWFCGWRWFKHLFFAWAFLLFLYPVPFLDNVVAFPLRMVMSEASVNVLNFVGVGAVKTGTAILSAPDTLAGLRAGARFEVDVADPCSGIRSLFALMMVSALYGYFTQPGTWRKIVMFLCSIPLAVLGNLARILMLTVGTIAVGSETAIGTADDPSFFHMLAGFLVFGVAIAGLLGIGQLLNTDWHHLMDRFHAAAKTPTIRPPSVPPPGAKPSRVHDEY